MYKYYHKYNGIFSKFNYLRVFSMLIAVFLIPAMGSSRAMAQQSQEHIEYIKRYKDIALKHQKKYGIPASITLAQGLLESNAGRSRLATEANNHFGIKCGGDWEGETISHKAESGNECFRKYDKAEDSFRDHALFLKRKRYEPLFKHKVTDYKKWAKTLRKCGYATDSKYPDKLINLIERYDLQRITKKGK